MSEADDWEPETAELRDGKTRDDDNTRAAQRRAVRDADEEVSE